MRTDDFDFELPQELIAQTALEPRDSSRMMVLHRNGALVEHRSFRDVLSYLRQGDLLVVNDTRVMPSRLRGERAGGGSAEVLLLKELDGHRWEALVKPGRRLTPGAQMDIGGHRVVVESVTNEGIRILRFDAPAREVMSAVGEVPLPPYIHTEGSVRPGMPLPERYQTVYSRDESSAAAPTAGLHFTGPLLDEVRAQGVEVASVTLDIGWETFRPMRAEHLDEHEAHTERFHVTAEAADAVARARRAGGRVIAVGTTSTRVLESRADLAGEPGDMGIDAGSGETDLFISPGYEFKVVNGLLTNFHLPRTSLLMLVSAFLGRDATLAAYREAVEQRYRFFSLGDCMLIL